MVRVAVTPYPPKMKIKKIACLILVLPCLVLASCATSKAKTREIVGEVSTSSIAEIHIYAYGGDGRSLPLVPNMGHAFISIRNLSNNSFDMGQYRLEAGEEVSIGLWGQEASWSIWFDLEVYYLKKGLYKKSVSVKRGIESLVEIEALSNLIKNTGKWTFSNTCTTFALNAWNLGAGEDRIGTKNSTPKRLKEQIKRFSTCETERKITSNKSPSFIKGGEFIYVTPK